MPRFFTVLWLGLALFLFTSRLTLAQQITTVAGRTGFGTALNQVDPTDVFVDEAGYMYVADYFGKYIIKFPPNSTSGTTVYGHNPTPPTDDGICVNDIFMDKSGNLYVACQNNSAI